MAVSGRGEGGRWDGATCQMFLVYNGTKSKHVAPGGMQRGALYDRTGRKLVPSIKDLHFLPTASLTSLQQLI